MKNKGITRSRRVLLGLSCVCMFGEIAVFAERRSSRYTSSKGFYRYVVEIRAVNCMDCNISWCHLGFDGCTCRMYPAEYVCEENFTGDGYVPKVLFRGASFRVHFD
jgi:hypothetical protein